MVCKSHTGLLTLDQFQTSCVWKISIPYAIINCAISHVYNQCRLTLHCLQVFHVQGASAAGASCGRHRGEKVSRVRASVARQKSHLVVVLGCGQTCVRGWSRRTIGSAKWKQGTQKVKVTDEQTKRMHGRAFLKKGSHSSSRSI